MSLAMFGKLSLPTREFAPSALVPQAAAAYQPCHVPEGYLRRSYKRYVTQINDQDVVGRGENKA